MYFDVFNEMQINTMNINILTLHRINYKFFLGKCSNSKDSSAGNIINKKKREFFVKRKMRSFLLIVLTVVRLGKHLIFT